MPNLYSIKIVVDAKHPAIIQGCSDLDIRNLEIKVFVNPDDTFFCDAPRLGCSRNYEVSDPTIAVKKFLEEHGYYMIKLREVER